LARLQVAADCVKLLKEDSRLSRQIHVSTSNLERLGRAAEFLRRQAETSEVLVIAPTRGAADDFVRGCWRDHGPLAGVHRATPVMVARELATERLIEGEYSPIGRLGVQALAARSLHLCRRTEELAYFGPVADTPGFVNALAATIQELRLEGVDAPDLAATGRSGADLARLLASYQTELSSCRLVDVPALYELAAGLTTVSRHRWLTLPLISLDLPLRSLVERRFFRVLMERAPAVCATALEGDLRQAGALKDLLSTSAHHHVSSAPTTALACVQQRLFAAGPSHGHGFDQTVHFFSAPGEGLEAVEIARSIRSAAESGVPFDQIAILLRHPDAYSPLILDALRRACIPAHCTSGAIVPHPAGRAFLALLDCANERLSASKFAEYLSLGQVPFVGAAGTPPPPAGRQVLTRDEAQMTLDFAPAPDPNPTESTSETDDSPAIAGTLRTPFAWEQLLIDAAVIGGKARWSRRLAGLEHEFQLRLDSLKDDDDYERVHLQRQLARLHHLERFALPLIEVLDSLRRTAFWGDWLIDLRKLAEMALREPEPVLEVLSELDPMETVGPVALDEVRRVLTDRLSVLRNQPESRRYGKVFVGSIDEAAGRSFDIVFLPGLGEGVFPRKPFEDPLLLDEFRAKLKSHLAMQADRDTEERLLLRRAAAAARSRLCVSYSRIDTAQGRSRVPSFYALEVLRAVEGKIPNLRELEARAAAASRIRLGWPAPAERTEAIDDCEYDLALLNEVLLKPREEARGHGRYLVEASPILRRALRQRRDRWSKQWTEADGVVFAGPDGVLAARPEVLSALSQERLSARSYSPSALQHYAACPYRFLLQAIHRLREREEAVPIESLDPLTRGALFHKVQYELLGELKRDGLLPFRPERASEILTRLDATLNRVADSYRDELAPAIPQVWKSDIEDIRTDLRGWVRESARAAAEWLPLHFEFAFGMPFGPERDPESHREAATVLDHFRLRGSIDLIEEDAAHGKLRVVDHKTGKVRMPLPVSVGNGEVLQPLLYALAVEDLLKQPVTGGVLSYCTQLGNYSIQTVPLDENGRKRVRCVLETIDEAIRNGFLPAAPRADACAYCDYARVCGPREEQRVGLKPTDPLDALNKVRCLP
jgi:CRISPR/Cas system-associated exonuclease Cas4 (RecB family)